MSEQLEFDFQDYQEELMRYQKEVQRYSQEVQSYQRELMRHLVTPPGLSRSLFHPALVGTSDNHPIQLVEPTGFTHNYYIDDNIKSYKNGAEIEQKTEPKQRYEEIVF